MELPVDTRKFVASAALALVCGIGWMACNEHPVEYSTGTGAVEHVEQIPATGQSQLDLLWVIDNSFSMCEEQQELRENFTGFLEQLTARPIDFHMAVTTTHFNPESTGEHTVSRGGHLQTTPHPAVGPGESCRVRQDEPESNAKYAGKYAPIRRQIEAAVECTAGYSENPEEFPDELTDLYDPNADEVAWSDAAIECALEGSDSPEACSTAAKDPDSFTVDSLFPCSHLEDLDGDACSKKQLRGVYRTPDTPMLRARNYRNDDGTFDTERFQRDFQCMSYVGTRGVGQEQGLRAAVEAVSPRLTGGPVGDPIENVSSVRGPDEDWSYPNGDPTQAPNHGFLRKDANTAVIFITDENDCSRPPDGPGARELTERYQCPGVDCYFAAKQAQNGEGPLYTTEDLAKKFMDNLAASKKVDEVPQEDVLMASIHGNYQPYTGPIVEQCRNKPPTSGNTGEYDTRQEELTDGLQVCDTELGSARSGDRYEGFLRNFDRFFPRPKDGKSHLKGWMCQQGGFGEGLTQIPDDIQHQTTCIDKRVPCNGDADCPAYQYGPTEARCRSWADHSTDRFCQSALQVRLRYADGTADRETAQQALRDSGLCYTEANASADSIGLDGFPRTCVVRRSAYSWQPCPGAPADQVTLAWNPSRVPNPGRQLADFEVEIRYTELVGDKQRSFAE
jgi:hypothetical protein